jgi:hypothetical protein
MNRALIKNEYQPFGLVAARPTPARNRRASLIRRY